MGNPQRAGEKMKYISTNRRAPAVEFSEALLKGQAPDGGLYWPEALPKLSAQNIQNWREKEYYQIVAELLEPFTKGSFEREELEELSREAYNFPIPLEQVPEKNIWIMRLDRGPTASFKDFAARMMARMMGRLLQRQNKELIVLTATSGDTGSAIANAFLGVPGIKVVILFPLNEVTPRQRKQMTTLGQNITALAVEGKFDDCQAFVKRAFLAPQLKEYPLTSANSINIGRLLPQMGYYAYSYTRLSQKDTPFWFSIPSGNFGNMMGATLLKTMGLPIDKLIIAVNENDEFPRFLETSTYQKISPSKNCLSNAMNVGHPSNLARLVHLYGGWLDEKGQLHQKPDLQKMRRDLFSTSITDRQTKEAIREAHQKYQILLEPHGAVAWAGMNQFLQTLTPQTKGIAVCAETAHPAKFPEVIREVLNLEPEIPPSLKQLEQKRESYEKIPADYQIFIQWFREKF